MDCCLLSNILQNPTGLSVVVWEIIVAFVRLTSKHAFDKEGSPVQH